MCLGFDTTLLTDVDANISCIHHICSLVLRTRFAHENLTWFGIETFEISVAFKIEKLIWKLVGTLLQSQILTGVQLYSIVKNIQIFLPYKPKLQFDWKMLSGLVESTD